MILRMEISAIPAFTDNYLWLLTRGSLAWVVDPGDARPVLETLQQRGLTLAGILITHHHSDHIGGVRELLAAAPVPVWGPRAESRSIAGLTRLLDDGQRVAPDGLGLEFEVLAVPGHTLGHIAYWCAEQKLLFCGDTLFSAGCGRLFEGTPGQMHASLSRLLALPPATAVYCTHEYTLQNLAFAQRVEPDNRAIAQAVAQAQAQRARAAPTLPSNLGRERSFNPFLRCTEPAVIAAAEDQAGRRLSSAAEVFAVLRRWKDSFRAPAG